MEIVTTGTGASDSMKLPPRGDFMLFITWAGTPGDADLQIGVDGTFVDMTNDSLATINITKGLAIRVPGGLSYRLDVNTHSSVATMKAIPISSYF